MIFCPAEELLKEAPVGMGQAVVAREPTRLTAILGSCVAVTLYAPRLRLGMISHVVLPYSNGNTVHHPAKFADTAVPHMLSVLKEHGIKPGGLIAKIVGGACMFGANSKFMDIGDSNARAAVQALEATNIPIAGRDVAGTVGRRICFDLSTGCLSVESPGHPLRTI
jgi:chemotaxis protein CheD